MVIITTKTRIKTNPNSIPSSKKIQVTGHPRSDWIEDETVLKPNPVETYLRKQKNLLCTNLFTNEDKELYSDWFG